MASQRKAKGKARNMLYCTLNAENDDKQQAQSKCLFDVEDNQGRLAMFQRHFGLETSAARCRLD